TKRVFAGLEATYRDLRAKGDIGAFDFHLLSDSTDPEVAAAEERGVRDLRRRLGAHQGLFYRRRRDNEGRKAGNLAEFCRRWGAHYDYMVVLDADSVMTGDALERLVRAMQANPDAGMIQTVPIPIGQQTMFGRFVQFAATLYSPMLAAGLSFWQTDTANYWGHNAIIRVRAFMDHCGLPVLPGKPPLGGEILSHDFVEAALIRRGGWHVYLFAELEGSHEEVPGTILDFAKRDRRWAEGNLQHMRLLGAHGLHPLNRVYFVMGALAYGCSLLWFLMLAAGTVDAVTHALTTAEYFKTEHQLFPDWPIARTAEMMSLIWMVAGMLVLPKVMGVLLHLISPERRRAFGGGFRLVAGAVIELFFSVLIAPVMMSFHAYFVASVLCGRKVKWNAQNREGRQLPWSDALRNTFLATLGGILWGVCTASITPIFFWSLTPVLVGLVLAAPLVRWSSSPALGGFLRRHGLFVVPAETSPSAVVRLLEEGLALRRPLADEVRDAHHALEKWPERPQPMPTQRLDAGPKWNVGDVAPLDLRALNRH
ncbi:MAG: glucans biosynthesis glucosyltransferase MdoH, partial [Ectothiorhodospiraceae bacterium]